VENMEKSNVYKDLVRKAGGKRLLGWCRHLTHPPRSWQTKPKALNKKATVTEGVGKIIHLSILPWKIAMINIPWEDTVKISVEETGCENVDLIYLAQDRVQWWAHMNMKIHLWVP
jgi:hypothetical protein